MKRIMSVVCLMAVFWMPGITMAAGVESVVIPPAVVNQIKVQPDLAPDCTSLKAIVESVTRGCRNNDEKAVAIYNFMQLAYYHRGTPDGETGGIPALKAINCYGWSLCGGLHAAQSSGITIKRMGHKGGGGYALSF